MRRPALLGLVGTVVITACITTSGGFYPLDKRGWDAAAAEVDDDEVPAIILRREKHVRLVWGSNSFTEVTEHAVVRVMTEAGVVPVATFAVRMGKHAELREYDARSISPDGTVHDLLDVEIFTETTTYEGEEVKSTIFRIPSVEVGTTVETTLVYRLDYVASLVRDVVSRPYMPTVRYDVTLEVDKDLEFEFRVYNMKTQPTLEPTTRGKRIRLSLRDVPAQKDEIFAPDSSLEQPWWLFGIKRYGVNYSVAADWDSAMHWMGEQLYVDDDEDYFDDPDVTIDTDRCTTDVCRAELALDYVQRKTRFTGHEEWWGARKASKVLASGYASNQEKAFLLYVALDEVGLTPRLAALNRFLTRGYDFAFPSALWFNHHVVVVPALKGPGGGPLVIDPSCEHCAMGALPYWSRGQKALLFEPVLGSQLTGRYQVTTTWLDLPKTRPPESSHAHTLELFVEEDGRYRLAVRRRWTGESAVNPAIDDRNDDDRERLRRLKADFRGRFVGGKLTKPSLRACDRQKGLCEEGYEVVGRDLGVRSDRQVLTLLALTSTYDARLLDEERRYDISIARDMNEVQTFRVHLPKGWVLDEGPSERVENEAFRYTLETSRTPDGARVTRRLDMRRGRFSKADYQRLREPLLAYDAGKRELLIFRKAPVPKNVLR